MSSILDCPVEIICIIVEYLDVKSALQLRLTSRLLNNFITKHEGFQYFRKRCLNSLLQYYGPPRHRGEPKHWNHFRLMNDEHLCWLLDSSTTHLRIGGAPYITNKTMEYLGEKCPNLESLYFNRSGNDLRCTCSKELSKLTTEGCVSMIKGCPKLRFLSLSWCEHVNGNAVAEAINNSLDIRNSIELLNLNGVRLGNEGIQHIGNFSKLKRLENKDSGATDISPLARCPLEVLHVCRSCVSSESAVKSAEGFRETIKEFCFMGNWNIKTEDAKKIIKMCPNLHTFNCVRGCNKVKRGVIEKFCKKNKRKLVLDVPH